jgi:murein DD-endopeptidase MepM/ murein hydrolase activator NlpD
LTAAVAARTIKPLTIRADIVVMVIRAALTVVAALLLAPSALAATGNADVAALQVALRARGVYTGPVDGLFGPQTTDAIRLLASATPSLTGMAAAGPGDLRAMLGPYARFRLGERPLRPGLSGWDVAAFQFLLSWQGFPSGPMDGVYSERTSAAVSRFQTSRGIPRDGAAGPTTIAAVRAAPLRLALTLASPLRSPPPATTFFGPRDNRFHTGLDYPAKLGTPVRAAAAGTVVFAGADASGYGLLVTIDHRDGLRTLYAHLSKIRVRIGQSVATGVMIGQVGSTGRSFGPHLHFEVRLRDAALDPMPSLGIGASIADGHAGRGP